MDQDLRPSDLVSLASRLEARKFVEVQRAGLSASAQEFREILWQELRLVAQHWHHSRETLLLASALELVLSRALSPAALTIAAQLLAAVMELALFKALYTAALPTVDQLLVAA